MGFGLGRAEEVGRLMSEGGEERGRRFVPRYGLATCGLCRVCVCSCYGVVTYCIGCLTVVRLRVLW